MVEIEITEGINVVVGRAANDPVSVVFAIPELKWLEETLESLFTRSIPSKTLRNISSAAFGWKCGT
jgi:hypothetical protein